MRLNEPLVKTLCGGDNIRARRMRQDFEEFAPSHTVWLATNHRPIIKGGDRGIWRRIKLVPFTVSIPEAEQDGKLGEKLRGEANGILNWILTGCIEWQRDGLGSCESIQEATNEYRNDMDTLGAFIEEWCLVDDSYRIKASKLYAAYRTWAEGNGEYVETQTMFGNKVADRGFGKRRSNGIWFLGITTR